MRFPWAAWLMIALWLVAPPAAAKPGKGRGWHKHTQPVVVVRRPAPRLILRAAPVIVVPVRQAPRRPAVTLRIDL